MHNKLTRLAVVLMAVVAVGLVATPAHASLSNCTGATKVCLWAGVNWSGSPNWTSTMPVGPGACVNVGAPGNNNAESMLNETPYTLSFYSSASGVGYMFTVPRGSGISNLAVYPPPGGWQNNVSSVCRG